ncbi:hypothetical protein [Deinococcus sp. ME38]|uniref:hypothetical protein n=1 Tax=Deinococcus sp. ME38 TaxID=3400344 RepID=UPI003B5B8EAB
MNAAKHLFGPRPESLLTFPDGLEQVVLGTDATRLLRRAAQERGAPRSGLLFGRAVASTLEVTAAMMDRPPTLPLGEPLALDPAFLLGASEALLLTSSGLVDWCGMWIVEPDSEWMPEVWERRWFRQAFRQGLVNDQRLLLQVGFDGGLLVGQALIGDAMGAAVPLPLTWP